MSKIFGVIYRKSSNDDFNLVIQEDGEVDTRFASKSSLSEEDLEYIEKVSSYTSYQIGAKI